jgi:hypothetical protein
MVETKAIAGQEYFRLIVETGIDFHSYVPTNQFIECVVLGGDRVLWDAEILAGSESLGKIYHDFGIGSAAVPILGRYQIRGKLIIDGKIAYTLYSDWYVG